MDEGDDEKWLAQNDIHVAILEDQSAKNANTVIGIVRHSLKYFKQGHDEITSISIRFDNARCYHSKLTLQALHSLREEFYDLGLEIKGIHFNEPGI